MRISQVQLYKQHIGFLSLESRVSRIIDRVACTLDAGHWTLKQLILRVGYTSSVIWNSYSSMSLQRAYTFLLILAFDLLRNSKWWIPRHLTRDTNDKTMTLIPWNRPMHKALGGLWTWCCDVLVNREKNSWSKRTRSLNLKNLLPHATSVFRHSCRIQGCQDWRYARLWHPEICRFSFNTSVQ